MFNDEKELKSFSISRHGEDEKKASSWSESRGKDIAMPKSYLSLHLLRTLLHHRKTVSLFLSKKNRESAIFVLNEDNSKKRDE
jgi:hypothetical protein